jgi:hypothetical protein
MKGGRRPRPVSPAFSALAGTIAACVPSGFVTQATHGKNITFAVLGCRREEFFWLQPGIPGPGHQPQPMVFPQIVYS